MSKAPLKRILYVDDEPDLREIVNMSLTAFGGFEVLLCESGAVALAKAPDFRPQLVLLDVMMPEMDGPSTFEALRSQPDASAEAYVFITAKALETEIKRLKSLGAMDVIVKPFDPVTLHDRIGAIWDKAARSAEQDPKLDVAPLTDRFRLRMVESLSALQSARAQIAADGGSTEQQVIEQLTQTSHGLAGSAGTFGFHDVSAAASAFETIIDAEAQIGTPEVAKLVEALDGLIATVVRATMSGPA